MTLAQVLAQLCGGDPVRFAAFLQHFPTQASFDPVFAAFGTQAAFAGFLATRYQDDFGRLRADYLKLGAATLTAMVAGTAKVRDQVGTAVVAARKRLDDRLPPLAAPEPPPLVAARAARAKIDALWGALPPYPVEPDLRAVVEAIREADAAVEVAVKVTGSPAVDPAARKEWDEKRAALSDRLGVCREDIMTLRTRALPGTDFSRITELLATIVNGLSELDAGGIDEPWLEKVRGEVADLEAEIVRVGNAIRAALRRARVMELLTGPFDELGAALPVEYRGDRDKLAADPLAASEDRLAELEKVLPKLARAYVDTRGMEAVLRRRIEKLYGEETHKELDTALDDAVDAERAGRWEEVRKRYLSLDARVTKAEEKAAARDSKKEAEFLAAKALMDQAAQADAAALAWGKAQFDGNAILKEVWRVTHLNRQKCEKNARIAGNNHSWDDVATAIELWQAQAVGSGAVSNLHVPGGEPQAKWEKDPARQVAQANFICTWAKVEVNIHVTVDIRSFLEHGTWDDKKLPPELEQFRP